LYDRIILSLLKQNETPIQMTTLRLTTAQLAEKAKTGIQVLVNGNPKSYFQLRNMKGKTYFIEVVNEKIYQTVNVQTL
jgi:hypothetical protein